MIEPYYQDDYATIYHGDCREILPQLEPVDLVLTDPPYGLGDKWKSGGWKNMRSGQGRGSGRMWNDSVKWDASPVDSDVISEILRKAKTSIIWGGNYYSLPPSSGWLVWNKEAKTSQSQAELAWTNLTTPVRVFDLTTLGAFGNDGANGEKKVHSTQKPLPVIKWCLSFVPNAQTILDPFMGSGTTLRAAKDLGIKSIGIEIEEKYCEIAAERLRQEVLAFN